MTSTSQTWQNRIVGTDEVAPDQLLAHSENWRIHPKHQQDALMGVLDEVGWVGPIIVNQRTQTVLDGHLRVSLALRRNEPAVPVTLVDLSDDEERLILATYDPIGEMARRDSEKLDELLADLSAENEELDSLLEDLRRESAPPDFSDGYEAPTDSAIADRQAQTEDTFEQRSQAEQDRMVDLICPECGHEYSVRRDDLDKETRV